MALLVLLVLVLVLLMLVLPAVSGYCCFLVLDQVAPKLPPCAGPLCTRSRSDMLSHASTEQAQVAQEIARRVTTATALSLVVLGLLRAM